MLVRNFAWGWFISNLRTSSQANGIIFWCEAIALHSETNRPHQQLWAFLNFFCPVDLIIGRPAVGGSVFHVFFKNKGELTTTDCDNSDKQCIANNIKHKKRTILSTIFMYDICCVCPVPNAAEVRGWSKE